MALDRRWRPQFFFFSFAIQHQYDIFSAHFAVEIMCSTCLSWHSRLKLIQKESHDSIIMYNKYSLILNHSRASFSSSLQSFYFVQSGNYRTTINIRPYTELKNNIVKQELQMIKWKENAQKLTKLTR